MNNQPTCAKHKTKTTINLPLRKILILPAPGMSTPKNKRKMTTNIRQGAAKNKINKSTYLVTGSPICLIPAEKKKKTQELIRPHKQKLKIDLSVWTIRNTKQKNNNQPTSQNDPDTAYSRDVPAKNLKEKRRQKSERVQQKTKINKWTYLRKWTWKRTPKWSLWIPLDSEMATIW